MAIQRIRDPLHNLIEFDTKNELERHLWKVIQAKPFQRLRRIKQLGFSDLVYPGACHSRFAHSIGVFHTARRLMDVIQKEIGESASSKQDRALAAALVHDLGHGPFSHAFEKVGARLKLKLADHEEMSNSLIRDGEVADILNEMGSGFADDVADIVKKEGRATVYNAVVSSQFDADRLDYIRRDRLMTGTQHAAIDFEWLIANLRIAKIPMGVDEQPLGSIDTFVIGQKAVPAAEAFVLGLFQLYPTVYFHKATRGAELLFVELMVRLVEVLRDGGISATGLPARHPIVQFATGGESVANATTLDDAVIWGVLSLLAESTEALISEFALRLRDRKLYKCVDVRAIVTHQFDPKGNGNDQILEKIDSCCAAIYSEINQWREGNPGSAHRLLVDQAKRSPYKDAKGTTGPIERISVFTEGGEPVDLGEKSRVVASLSSYKLMRAYYVEHDESTKAIIDGFVDKGVNEWRTQ